MTSITEMLGAANGPEGLLEHLFGLNKLDRAVYEVLLEAGEPRRLDDVAPLVDRDRTSVYRSVKRLRSDGLVERHKRSLESGGYYHEFEAVAPMLVADEMQQRLNELYATIGPTLSRFKDVYGPEGGREPAI